MKKILIGLLLIVSCLSIFLFKPPKAHAYIENQLNDFETFSDIYYFDGVRFITDFSQDSIELALSNIEIYYTVSVNEYNEIIMTITELSFDVDYYSNTFQDNYYYNDFVYQTYNTYVLFDDAINIDYDTFDTYYILYLDIFLNKDSTSSLNVDFNIYNNLGVNVFQINSVVNVSFNEYIELGVTNIDFVNGLTDFFYQNYIENSTIHPEPSTPPDLNVDMWSWLGESIGGFMNFEILPGFSIGGILTIIISIALFIVFLKIFAGG